MSARHVPPRLTARLHTLHHRACHPGDAEARAAARLRDRLCVRHGLTLAVVAEPPDPDAGIHRKVHAGRRDRWLCSLAAAIAAQTQCGVVRTRGPDDPPCSYVFFGAPAHLARCVALFGRFREAIDADADRWVDGYRRAGLLAPGEARRKGDSFRKGEVAGIAYRFDALDRAARQRLTGRAAEAALERAGRRHVQLPVLPRRQDAVRAAIIAHFGEGLATVRDARASDRKAWSAGFRRGRQRTGR